jgi:signal transduction histidine kinase
VLVSVAAALRAAPTRGDMLPVIVNQTLSLFQAGGAALMMPDRNTQQMVIVLARGTWAERTGTRMPVNLAELPRFIPLDKPYLNNEVAADPHLSHIGLLGGQNAVACVPLVAAQQMIGLLWIGRTSAIAHADTNLLVAIGEIAASALHRAMLIETLEQRVAERTGELIQTNAQLGAANERLTELDRLKSKFVSTVSHELRTPVTSLGLLVDLLEHGKPEKREQYLVRLREQMTRLQTMINDILDLSRLERDASEADWATVDINPMVEHIVAMQRVAAETAGLQLSSEVSAGPIWVRARPEHLLRAITNLISNAIKYTRTGTVDVITYIDADRLCVQIKDTGLGIAPEDLSHLFERFYRGRQAAQSSIPGTGLGLSIVKEIVESHGGTVEVASELGVGSTFRLWLPAVIG